MSTWVAVACTAPSVNSALPPTWNIGIGLISTSPGPDARGLEGDPRVVGQAPVGEHRALGRARWSPTCTGPGRHSTGRRRGSGRAVTMPASPAAVNASQPAKDSTSRSLGSRPRISARMRDLLAAGVEQPVRLGVPEHVREFLALVGRVDGDQGQPGERRGELEDDPLGAVRRPDGDPLAGSEPGEQRPRRALGVGEQPGERPLASQGGVGVAVDKRDRLRRARGGVAKNRPDGGLAHRLGLVSRPAAGTVGGPVGAGQRGCLGRRNGLRVEVGHGTLRGAVGQDGTSASAAHSTRMGSIR